MRDLTGQEVKKSGIIRPGDVLENGSRHLAASADYKKVLAANKFALRVLETNLSYLHRDITPEGQSVLGLTREAIKILKGVQ